MRKVAVVASLGFVLLGACVAERPVIDRVQAVALKKSFYVGEKLLDASDDPEFYMRGVVIDVGYGSGLDGVFTSTYAQPVSRIRWEITENMLNARLGYERIQGTDDKGTQVDGLKRRGNNDGQIVAAYRITSHFDIKRAYNPTTGEALNIQEENSSDRPWYFREYFRVDWSTNMATTAYDFDTLSMMGIYGSLTYEPIPYAITDANHPDAPVFDLEKGYFDITTKAFAKPGVIDLSHLGWGIDKFPACYLPAEFSGGTGPYGNCNPTEITLRYSFKKVVDTDYEPVDWDGVRFQSYGFFYSEYKGYDRNYGLVDNKWFRFAGRYNIWDRSHYYADAAKMTGAIQCDVRESTSTPTGDPTSDPNRDNDGDGTSDECAEVTARTGFGGSRCDVFKGKCTLPYQARTAKITPWYINGNGEEDLFEATNWAVQEWNLGMQVANQTSRLTECRRTNGSDCSGRFPMWSGQQDDYDDAMIAARDFEHCLRGNGWKAEQCQGALDNAVSALASERGVGTDDENIRAIATIVKQPPVIVLCHNPVGDADHPSCGAKGTAPRMGDLRYHTVLNIDKPQQPSSWGIMVDADDPITGEKVAASINIWTHVTDLASTGLLDLIRYINGELTTAQITEGKYVHNWVQAQKLGARGHATMSKEEVDRRLSSATKLSPAAFAAQTASPMSTEVRARLRPAINKTKDVAANAMVASPSAAMVNAVMNTIRGTPAEAKLINPAQLQLAGIKGPLAGAGGATSLASPMGMNHPKLRSQIRTMRENALAKRGACILHEAPEMSSISGLAGILKKKFPVGENESVEQGHERHLKMFRYLRRRFHYAVIAHEMGHSIGLRHNFVSSYGALHFRQQYWQLRTKNGAVTTECTSAQTSGENCVGPRYYDPLTAEENDQLIWMFMQSSVMDYPGDLSQDMIGLGQYDYSATRMLYGDNVAVYKDTARVSAGNRLGIGMTNATDTFGGLVGIKYSIGVSGTNTDIHYSQLQRHYGLINDCYTTSPQAPSWWRREVDGEWDALLDGKIVSIGGEFKKCRQMPVDYMQWTSLRKPTDDEIGAGGFYRGGPSVDADGRVRVPHHFASDNWADLGNVSVFRHDNGADPYEQAMFVITTQENRHILDNFRRGRTSFSIKGAADRSFSRYNEKLVNIAGGAAFLSNIYKNFGTNTGYTFDTLWPMIVNEQMPQQILAATIAFDHMTRQIGRPEDGPHYKRDPEFNETVLRSDKDADGYVTPGSVKVTIPNGTTGFNDDVGLGGRPLENALSESNGDYDVEYDINAGSYYDKINAIIHLSLSEDRFISQSRGDFYDARFRANGMADIFPEAYRRLLANALTGDRSMLATYLEADANGDPLVNEEGYPAKPMGWVSWWPNDGPVVCFPSQGRQACSTMEGSNINLRPGAPTRVVPIDPQVGWEVQKFLIAWSLTYIVANQRTEWIDQMRIYKIGFDNDPEFRDRIEWQDPISGQRYVAKTQGKECIFGTGAACTGGKFVQKGIAARMLEYANAVTARGYKLDTVTYPALSGKPAGFNQYGRAMVVYHPDGSPVIAADPALKQILPNGNVGASKPDCDRNVNPTCTPLQIWDNRHAVELSDYKAVPDYLNEFVRYIHLGMPGQLGYY